ncbi:MAG TPA: hypothetical protein VH279_11990 [Solirubrobacteraceae bacterium]|nr:hypothetical protein [Solirubrobacteraceae bacterium]
MRPIATPSCKQPRSLARAPLPQESGVYRAGPLLLVTAEDLAQLPAGQAKQGSGIDAIAVVHSGRPVTLSVDRTAPVNLSLQFANPAADPGDAIRFPPCGGRLHRFGGAITFAGVGCARLLVSEPDAAPKPMLIPIGNGLLGCPRAWATRRLHESAEPFLGVACGVPNSITCDRVGVGVNLSQPAMLVMVNVAGRWVTLSPPTDSPRDPLWLGYLYDAGLRRGALDVGIPRRATRWFGTPEVQPPVTLEVFFDDGSLGTLTARGFLHPGFG